MTFQTQSHPSADRGLLASPELDLRQGGGCVGTRHGHKIGRYISQTILEFQLLNQRGSWRQMCQSVRSLANQKLCLSASVAHDKYPDKAIPDAFFEVHLQGIEPVSL